MTKIKLNDTAARKLTAPAGKHSFIFYDAGHRDAIAGFGLRVTKLGARSWVFNYRHRPTGIERRMTIGSFPSWGAADARDEAKRLRRLVEQDRDPMAERQAVRAAPTMDEAFDKYGTDYAPRKRTGEGDKEMIERHLRPALGRLKVDEVTHADIKAVHEAVTASGSPIAANRAVALISKVFSLATTWEVVTEAGRQPWRAPAKGNPARGIQRNPENKRSRYLDGDELSRLLGALAERKDASAQAIKLAILTGARRGEILGATWAQFDLKKGTWVKPASLVKQKKEHHLPLSPAAREVLQDMRALAEKRAAKLKEKVAPGDYLFPSRGGGEAPQQQLKRSWRTICKAAGTRWRSVSRPQAHACEHAGLGRRLVAAHRQPAGAQQRADDPAIRPPVPRPAAGRRRPPGRPGRGGGGQAPISRGERPSGEGGARCRLTRAPTTRWCSGSGG